MPVRLHPPVSSRDHARGPDSALITLVQFGDYACPYCTELHPHVKRLEEELGEELRFVYRHFPVNSPSRSRRAAEIAEAAAAQDRFWEMHDLLSSESGARLSPPRLLELAESLQLDMDRVHHELEGHTHYDHIEADLESARHSSVRETPTFFLNGEHYTDTLTVQALRPLL